MTQFRFRYGTHAHGHESYLDYVRMKDYLHAHEDDEKDACLPPGESPYVNSTAFWDIFSEEINRVNKSYMFIMGEINEYLNDLNELAGSFLTDTSRPKKLRKIQETFLKRIATVLHTKISKLEDFRLLNRTAALKILNKYDKIATKKHGGKPCLALYLSRMNALEFGHGESLVLAKRNLEELYCTMFCDGVMEEARLKLSLSKTTVSPELMQMVFGKLGVILVLLVWQINNFILTPRMSMINLLRNDPAWCVYATVAALLFYRWLWGCCVYMWDVGRVDYMLVLSLDPNKHMLHCVDIYNDAANLTILYLINILSFHSLRFYYTHSMSEQNEVTREASKYAWLMPLFLLLGTLFRLIWSWVQPISYGLFSSAVFSRVFRSPFAKVLLRDNFAANIMCSFSPVFAGVLRCGCFFGTGAFLYTADPNSDIGYERYHTCASSDTINGLTALCFCLPLWIRLLQCMRLLYEYKVAPWSQPANNTTVDYFQQTSLDPAEDPTTEWGQTWFSPMLSEFENINRSHHSSGSSGCTGNENNKNNFSCGSNLNELYEAPRNLLDVVDSDGSSTAFSSEVEMSSFRTSLPLNPDTSLIDDTPATPTSPTTTTNTSTNTSKNTSTIDTSNASSTLNPGDTGLRVRPRGWSSAARLLNDVGEITVNTEGDASTPSGKTYACNSTHKGTQSGTHVHYHTTNIVNHSPNTKRSNSSDDHEGANLGTTKTSGKTSILNSIGRTSSQSTSSSKSNIEWGSTFFNPLFGTPTHTNTASGDNDGSGSHEHDSNDESNFSNVDSFRFSNTFPSGSGGLSYAHRSAHSLSSIVRKVCATPIKILTPYYYSLRTYTDPCYARFKTVWVWPHAQNAFQYVLQIMVVLIGAFPPQDPSGAAYITCFSLFIAFTVVYLSYWDIVVDCQLLQNNSEKPLLRKKLYYEEFEFFYYAFLFLNPVCRLLYVLSFTPFGRHPVFALFEIARRIGWAILRMEVAYVQELARRRAH